MNVKLRLYGFAPAIVLLAGLVGWAGHSAWRQLKQLRKNFGAVQSESFHLAEHVEASILTLSETVLRFDLRKDPVDKDHFHKENEELKRWIRKSSVTTPRELELLDPNRSRIGGLLNEDHQTPGGTGAGRVRPLAQGGFGKG